MKMDLSVYDSPLGHWFPGLDNTDYSGNGRDLTVVGSSPTRTGGPTKEGSVFFSGSGSARLTQSDAVFRRTGDVSAEAVVLLAGTQLDGSYIFSCAGSTSNSDNEEYNNLWGITIYTAGLGHLHEYGPGNNELVITSLQVPKYVWTHVAMSRSGDVTTFAINGAYQQRTYTNAPTGGTSAVLSMGAWPPGGSGQFLGYIAMGAVYDRALSIEELKYLAAKRMGLRKHPIISVPRSLELTIPAGRTSSNLNNFPVQVDLSGFPDEFWENVHPTGKDIRVRGSDGKTKPIDLVWFDYEGRKGSFFTKLNVTSASPTTFKVEYAQDVKELPHNHTNGRFGVWSDYAWVSLFGADPRNRVNDTPPTVASGSFESLFVESISPNTFSHQGVAWDGTYYYITDTDTLRKYDKDFNLLIQANNITSYIGPPVNHAGDPCTYKDYLYVPMEFWSPSSWSDPYIALFRKDDLSFITAYALPGHHEGASCCIGPDGLLYIASFEDGTKLWTYDPDTLTPVGDISLSSTISQIQGITYWGGFFWVTSDSTDRIHRVLPDGTVVDSAWPTPSSVATEGIDAQIGALVYLHDPGGVSNGVVRRLVPENVQHKIVGGGFRLTSDAYYDYSVPSYTTYTLAASWSITDSLQRSQMSYLKDDSQRVSFGVDDGDKAAVWDSTNLWLYASPNLNPIRNRIYRQHVVYNGNTSRQLYLEGNLANTHNGISTVSDLSTLRVGRSAISGSEPWRGFIGYAYLRPGTLSAAWIAAEALNTRDPTYFVRLSDADITVDGDPVAHWIFGANYLDDQSGNGLNLTLNSGTFTSSSESFDGTNTTRVASALVRLIQTDNIFRTTGLGAITVECVIKLPKNLVGQSHIAMVSGNPGGTPEPESDNILWALRYDAATNGLSYIAEYGPGTNSEWFTGVLLPYDRWLHITLTRNAAGNRVRFYVNGRKVAENTTQTAPTGGSNANLVLFAQPNNFDPYLGAAAMMAIYDEELDEDVVKVKARLRMGF